MRKIKQILFSLGFRVIIRKQFLHFEAACIRRGYSYCLELWTLLKDLPNVSPKCLPIHLMWTLHFLKDYSTEDVLSGRFRGSPKNFRKWVWKMLHYINELDLVKSYCSVFMLLSLNHKLQCRSSKSLGYFGWILYN